MEKFTSDEIAELKGLVKTQKMLNLLWGNSDIQYREPNPLDNEVINQDEIEALRAIVNLIREVDKLKKQVLILAKETKFIVDLEEKK